MTKKHYQIRNPDLTKKALDYIYKHGRDNFAEMIDELIVKHKSPTKAGWVKHRKVK